MTGEAHDQLHIVLVPILEEITDIKDTENSSELEEKVTVLQGLIMTYFEFSEVLKRGMMNRILCSCARLQYVIIRFWNDFLVNLITVIIQKSVIKIRT